MDRFELMLAPARSRGMSAGFEYSCSRRFWTLAFILGMSGLIGCGGSAPSPSPEQTLKSEPAIDGNILDGATIESMPETKQPTGGMTLPEGVVPEATPPGDQGNSSESDGLQLPPDFEPGKTDASSKSPLKRPVIQYATWGEVLDNAPQAGRLTVVDLWSLACAPCLKEYPSLVALQKRFGDRVQAVGANLDFDGRKTRPPEYYEPKVQAFLSAVGADFPNFIINTPSDDVYQEVGIASIPAVLVFDENGKLVKKFSDSGETAGFTYETDVVPLIEKLLG